MSRKANDLDSVPDAVRDVLRLAISRSADGEHGASIILAMAAGMIVGVTDEEAQPEYVAALTKAMDLTATDTRAALEARAALLAEVMEKSI